MSDDSATEAFEDALRREPDRHFHLKLYVAGATPGSRRAVANLTALCERHLRGHYLLEIVDIYQNPGVTGDEQILAVPTLVRLLPLPVVRMVGDLSDTEKVLLGLDLRPVDD